MGHWIHWKNRILLQLHRLTVKKILLFILCLSLLLLPFGLAVTYRNYSDSNSNADVFSVTLYNEGGYAFGYDVGAPKSSAADSLLWIFYQFPMEMKQINTAPGDPDTDTYIRAVTDLNGKTSELFCYFSLVASSSYCVDGNGTIYSIPTQYSEAFLATSYAEPFYPTARIPELITIDKDIVSPIEAQWYYKNYNDHDMLAQQNVTSQSTRAYELTGALGMSFSLEPDYCETEISDGGTLLYSGSLPKISGLTVNYGREMTVSIHAIWTKENHPDAYGELRYEFPVRIRNQSEFFLGSDTIPVGGFTTLHCTNITDLSKIDFSSDIEGLVPIFHQDGEYARALLIVPEDTPLGAHVLTITYGASSQTFFLHVTSEETPADFSYPHIPLKNPLAGLDSAVAEWKTLLHALPEPQSTVYFRGNFLFPADSGFRTGYTHQSRVQWTNDIISSAVGHEFLTDQPGDAAVNAIQSGTVIQTGACTLLGNYVVMDHGCGLRVWYGHLSDFDVEAGDIVRQGQAVGKTGDGGASTGNGFLIICTIYENIIDPSLILGKTID